MLSLRYQQRPRKEQNLHHPLRGKEGVLLIAPTRGQTSTSTSPGSMEGCPADKTEDVHKFSSCLFSHQCHMVVMFYNFRVSLKGGQCRFFSFVLL